MLNEEDASTSDAIPSSSPSRDPHYVRITSHGQIRTWVQFALKFLDENPTRSLVFHTLPTSAVPCSVVEGKRASTNQASEPALKQSTVNIPRLISVVEIVKREYVKACRTSWIGLHQYNQVGCLENIVPTVAGNDGAEDEPEETRYEKAEEARRQELVEVLEGKRHLKVKKTPYMCITLSRDERPDLVGQGASYQEPIVKQLTKSARARTNKRRKKEEAAQAAVQSGSELAQA